jgi:hypothetical protein
MDYQNLRERLHEEDPRIVKETLFGTSWTSLVSTLSVSAMFLFALIGGGAMWFDKAPRRHLALLCSVILSFAIGYSFFVGKMRYRIPVEPYILLCSAYGLGKIWSVLPRGRREIRYLLRKNSHWSARQGRGTNAVDARGVRPLSDEIQR